MSKYKGSHGTSRSRAESIRNATFRLSDGIKGTGAYFWRYNDFAIDLARGWHGYCLRSGRYAGDEDLRCAVIVATMEADDSEVVNLTDMHLHDQFLVVAARIKNIKGPRIHDKFVEALGTERGKKVKIVITAVPVPKATVKFFPTHAAKDSVCYVVKDVSCITGLDIKFC